MAFLPRSLYSFLYTLPLRSFHSSKRYPHPRYTNKKLGSHPQHHSSSPAHLISLLKVLILPLRYILNLSISPTPTALVRPHHHHLYPRLFQNPPKVSFIHSCSFQYILYTVSRNIFQIFIKAIDERLKPFFFAVSPALNHITSHFLLLVFDFVS